MFGKRRELQGKIDVLNSNLKKERNDIKNMRYENDFLRKQCEIYRLELVKKEKENYCDSDMFYTKKLIEKYPIDSIDINSLYPYTVLKTRSSEKSYYTNKINELADSLEREKNDVAILENQLNQVKREYQKYRNDRENNPAFKLIAERNEANKKVEVYKEQMILKDNALEKKNVLLKELNCKIKTYQKLMGIIL